MLGRLFLGLHWIVFIAFVIFGSLVVLVLIGDPGANFLVVGWVLLLLPIFLFIDWIINGKWTWFPWQRSK